MDNVEVSSKLIELQPFIDDNLLLLVDIEMKGEENMYLKFCSKVG